MRLRNISGSKEVIAASPYVIQDPRAYKGRWSELFHNSHPIRIEVGMGKGQFLMEMARRNPQINYIGIEMYDSVLLRALQKRERLETELFNIFFIRMDARELPEVFEQGEVDRIYLNFSDPWPRNKHAKRRLTHPNLLRVYDAILKNGGEIWQKTDNPRLFEFSLCSFSQFGYTLYDITFDLHSTDFDNIMTEYERNFSEKGMNIYRCVARKPVSGN